MDYKKSVDEIGDCAVITNLELVSQFEANNHDIVSIFEKMMATLPQGNFAYQEDRKRFVASAVNNSKGNWYSISITNKNAILVGFDVGFGQDMIDKYVDDLLNHLIDSFSISLLNIKVFEERLRVLISNSGNHYKMFLDALVGDNPLSRAIAGRTIYSFSPDILFSVDESKSSVCTLTFKGAPSRNEIDTNKYKEPSIMEINCGVARLSNFIEYQSLNQLVQKHRELTRNIVLGSVMEHVLIPLHNLTKTA